jgi:hypothetical protein
MNFGQRLFVRFLACTAFVFGAVNIAFAAPVSWTDWTSAIDGDLGSATGTLSTLTGNVGVTYSGEVFFAQTSSSGCVGSYCSGNIINYWAQPDGSSSEAYISSAVDNAPRPFDIIALIGGPKQIQINPQLTIPAVLVNTITFSDSVTNPVMAINSLGRIGISDTVEYHFSAEDASGNELDWTLLSYNQSPKDAYWGYGELAKDTFDGDVLDGREGSGVIQFSGAVKRISWTVPDAELWHGVTVGAQVPVPGAVWLLGSAILGLVGISRRKA